MGHLWGTEGARLAARRTPLLLRGSSVTERLRVAGNADWQEKRVPRCWPLVDGGTSGLECGAGKLLPSTAMSSMLESRSGLHRPLNTNLREPKGPHTRVGFASGEPQGRDSHWRGSTRTAAPEALAGIRSSRSEAITRLVLAGSTGHTEGATQAPSMLRIAAVIPEPLAAVALSE